MLKLKPYRQYPFGSANCSWDAGIPIDVQEGDELADVIILVSGDRGFDLLAKKIRITYGKKIEAYGVPSFTAASLMNEASQFIPINKAFLLR